MKTATEFIKNKFPNHDGVFILKNIEEFMIEFAKMHVLKIKHLQQSKYYSGETGYIKSEEWENIINNIK